MKYMGSKSRLAKHILPFLYTRNGYYEPFAGGMNLIDKYNLPCNFKIANDSNPYLISMFQALTNGWKPKKYYSRDEYEQARKFTGFMPHEIGWIGFNCSYSGKWFGGFAGIVQTKNGERNYQHEAYRHVLNQILNLKDVIFTNQSYDKINFKSGSTIYCDPPYEGTTGYIDKFDHSEFWEWVRYHSKSNRVIVSEYNAPIDFECIWSGNVKSSLSANGKIGGSKTSVERLFMVRK